MVLNSTIKFLKPEKKHVYFYHSLRQEEMMCFYNPVLKLTPEQIERLLMRCGSDLKKSFFAEYRWIVEREGALIGGVTLKNFSPMMGYAEIGYQISEEYHGRGLGTEVVRAFISKVFKESKLTRLQALVHFDNKASWCLLEKLKFVREGVLRKHFIVNGLRVDHYLYGLLREEWLK